MKVFKNILVTLFLCTILTACWNDHSWNQKITIVMETPDGNKIGSSVTHVKRTKNRFFKDGGPWLDEVIGEATFVDLGGGKYIFAIVDDYYASMAIKTINVSKKTNISLNEHLKILNKPIEILPMHYPTMVVIDDVNNPASIREIKSQDLEIIFGIGYSINKITLEFTEEKITKGLVGNILNNDFFQLKASLHKEALNRGLQDPYLKTIGAKLSRDNFLRLEK